MPTRRQFLATAASAAALGRAADRGFVRVSRQDARYLELSSGDPYIPIGLNLIAPPRSDGGPEESYRVFAGWLDKLSANGGNYIRVWLSNPFWEVEHARSGEYDAGKAAWIDRMLKDCRSRGIRVKMTMEHFRSIGEPPVRQPWADKPMHLAANGGPAKSITDFFDGEAARAQFRRKIQWYAERYSNNPVIYGWELWNEINAVRGGDYLAWTEAMLPELHKAFPANLAMQSLGSFDTDRSRDAYRRHSTMAGNDLAQVHRYLDLGAPLDICHGPVDLLAADAVRELIGYEPGRPVLLAESGAVEPKHSGPFRLYGADKSGMLLHDVLFAPFFAGAAGPGQIWHWDSYVAANDLWWHYDRFSQTMKGIDPRRERFEAATVPHDRARVSLLRGRRTSLLWIRDSGNTWMSELGDGRPPETLKGLSVDLAARIPSANARIFDPWQNRWTESKVAQGRLELPPFSRSLVVQLEH
jgi:hypothetical protein